MNIDIPASERIQFVEGTLDSIGEDAVPLSLSAEEREESGHRLAGHRTNPFSSIPWYEVRASLCKAAFGTSGAPIVMGSGF